MTYYHVVKYFTDLQDHNHPYHVGDVYPRLGVSVSEARLAELCSSANKRGVPLIEAVNAVEEKTTTVEADLPFMNEPESEIEPQPEEITVPKKRGRKPKRAE